MNNKNLISDTELDTPGVNVHATMFRYQVISRNTRANKFLRQYPGEKPAKMILKYFFDEAEQPVTLCV